MKQKFLSVRHGITALLVILLFICGALGMWFISSSTAFADEDEGDSKPVQLQNAWTTLPRIGNWEYKKYDRTENLIEAQPKYGTPQFMVWEELEDNNVQVVTYGESGTVFVLDEDGYVPEYVAETFNALKVGTYYLVATVEEKLPTETEDGYTALGGTMHVQVSGYQFSIIAPSTGWSVTPSIVSWTWDRFDPEVNVITAVSPITGVKQRIVYGVYTNNIDSASYAVAGLTDFYTRVEGGTNNKTQVDKDIAERLAALPAGNYYLYARVVLLEETNDENLKESNLPRTFVPFSVLQIQNHWEYTPNIVPWAWDEYDPDVNVLSATPAYMEKGAKVTYGIYTDSFCNFSASGSSVLLNFTEVGEAQENALAALDAKTYYIKATLPATSNYSALETVVSFTVRQNSNRWVTSPTVASWMWDNFDISVNTITSAPAYPLTGAQITYGIYLDKTCKNGVEGLTGFTEVTDELAVLLNGLPADTYWLKSEMNNGEANYADLSTVTSFSVMQAKNSWETSPYVISWNYGEYDRSVNRIFAQANYGTALFRIYKYTDEAQTQKEFIEFDVSILGEYTLFALDDNGLVPEHAAKTIGALDKGQYYVVCVVLGSNNYSDINVTEGEAVPLEVYALQNSWVEIPTIKSWVIGGFDSETNQINGKAKLGDIKYEILQDDKVLFTINSENGNITSVTSSDGQELDITALNSLDVGSYTLRAQVQGTGNYSDLSSDTLFAVFEDSVGLSGIIAATITFAVFDIVAAAVCVTLLVIRRRKVEEQFRKMVYRELNRR